MPYAAARSSRQPEFQILDPCNTASGLTVLTLMRSGPPSSARHRAKCNSAAFAEEYADAFFPAAMEFFEATKTRLPPGGGFPATTPAPTSSRSQTTTQAPREASDLATALPMPPAPPVTKAILPASSSGGGARVSL